MIWRSDEMIEKFLTVFDRYDAANIEKTLQGSYELGRESMDKGARILDLVEAYHGAMERMTARLPPDRILEFLPIARQVLKESLSPFDLAQAGVQDLIVSLQKSNQALEREIEERRKVEKEVLEVSQKEQRRFGAELHDGLCQKLVGISMLLHSMLRQERGGSVAATDLEKVTSLIDESAKQARDMAHGLFPVELQADALMLSLKSLAQRIETLYGIACRFHCPDAILIEDNNIATHLFRIAQEATNNSRKHGEAKQIEIELSRKDGLLHLLVRDDGQKGRSKAPSFGIGVQIMKYRARMIDAKLEFAELQPHGTLLTCSLRG